MTNTETLIAKLTKDNGLHRIEVDHEPVEDVLCGGWAINEERAYGVSHVLGDVPGEGIRYGYRVAGISQINPPDEHNKRTRVFFDLVPAPEMSHLIGQPSPSGKTHGPVSYVPTATLLNGTGHVEESTDGAHAVIRGVSVFVDAEGTVHITVPAGTEVRIKTHENTD
ncbi:hypothetical protein ACFYRW_22600 [Rhodococcus pyridinivorans]|uniref:hypothetical protein n=1 Tax=Rhodococcus pyridinivorans TaxID=103816 RepID=UPI00367D40F9